MDPINNNYTIGTATTGYYPTTTVDYSGVVWNTVSATSCNGNTHVFECKHERRCKCGKTERTADCPGCK